MTGDEYRRECEHAAAEIAREYYDDEAPTKGAPSCFPSFPDESDEFEMEPDDLPYHYAELEIPGEGTFLAIVTRIPVKAGPGLKYKAQVQGADQ